MMINVLIPMAGKNQFFSENEYPYPKPLIDISGTTMLERVVKNISTLGVSVRYIFIVNNNDCIKYHLDSSIKLLTNGEANIVKLDSDTSGSACSALMAIDYIGPDEPLVISNGDQIFDDDISYLIKDFECDVNVDAGVLCFDSVHPRWSYVKHDSNGSVIETAEKHPISRNAIAGFYYFKRGDYFISAAMNMIKKSDCINDNFYIAPTLNQLILAGKTVKCKKIPIDIYHTFYSPVKIKEYEMIVNVK